MLIRLMQMLLAVGGMIVVLRNGIVRVPGWGDATSMEPVHWQWHAGPFFLGLILIAVALALVKVRNE